VSRLDFVELLVKYRGNVQRLAAEMNVAYNTAAVVSMRL